jgi:hypothetical protein
MPKGKIDYSKSFIYKLCCKDVKIKEIYVGSTTNMRRRKSNHKSTCNNEEGRDYYVYVYHFIRENGGWENWDMVLIENYDAKDNLDLRKRERYWKDELKASLNSFSPYTTDGEGKERNKEYIKEYYQNNKQQMVIKNKEYYQNNKEKIDIRQKQPFNCICGGIMQKNGKSRHLKTKKHINFIENQNDLHE